MRFSQDIIPTLTIKQTQGHVSDQGVTYNQSGLTYNQLGYSYGGFYGYADVQPIISLATSPKPSIVSYADIYTQGIVADAGMPIGLLLSLTYPTRTVLS